jgi:outer membrane protein OmpA-like peptidoglycan-associated protein
MTSGIRYQILSLIAVLVLGVADLAWLNFGLAPRLAQQLQTRASADSAPAGQTGALAIAPSDRSGKSGRAIDHPADQIDQPTARAAQPADTSAEPQRAADPEPAAQPEPAAEPKPAARPEPAAQPEPPAKPEPAAQPEPQRPTRQAVAAAPAPAQASDTSPGVQQQQPELQDLLFPTGKASLHGEARQLLKRAAAWMAQNPRARLLIRGHADERGSEVYNERLARWRALTALRYVQALGIARDRLSMEAVGAAEPADPRNTEQAWAKNRRVQLVWR